MADVEISYRGNTIASMSASGTKTLLTASKYCDDDINVVYTAPSGGGFPNNVLTVNSLFNSNYQKTYSSSGTAPAYDGEYANGVIITCGGSRIQYGYIIIKDVDLTNINSITGVMSITGAGNGTSRGVLFISNTLTDKSPDVPSGQRTIIQTTGNMTKQAFTLDTTGFSGAYHIFFGADSGGASWTNSRVGEMINIVIH